MITVDGITGNGALWGCFRFGSTILTNGTQPMRSVPDVVTTPPTEWFLPPPDSVVYLCDKSKYGPRYSKLKVGSIYSVHPPAAFNDCHHDTLTGSALYRGALGVDSPYWRLSNALVASGWYNLNSQQAAWMNGRPAKSTDRRIFDRLGVLVSFSPSYPDNQDLWYRDSQVPATIASDALLSSLNPSLIPWRHGEWHGQHNPSGIPSARSASYYHYTKWDRVKNNVWKLTWYQEYHDDSSYTSSATVSPYDVSTGLGYLKCAEKRSITFTVVSIQSTAAGIFKLTVKMDETLSWWGWQPWSEYSGTKSGSQTVSPYLMAMAPGLSKAVDLSVNTANDYCTSAVGRCGSVYEHSQAKAARTLACGDVTELDSNWLENLSQIKGTLDVVKPLIQGYHAIRHGNIAEAGRALASAYLAYKYMIAPAISDAKDIATHGADVLRLATVNRFSNERRRGRVIKNSVPIASYLAQLTYTCTYHLRLKTNVFSQIWGALEKVGLEPSAGQVWDLIPFSFVVDWFYHMSDALHEMDGFNSMNINRDLVARIEAYKVQWDLPLYEFELLFHGLLAESGGPIRFSWYDRRVYDYIGTIDPFVGQFTSGLSVSQVAQGTALLSCYSHK